MCSSDLAVLADREGRRTFTQVRAAHTADRVEQLVSALEAVPPEVRPTLAATLGRGMTAQFAAPKAPLQENDAELTDALVDELGQDRSVTATAGTRADCAAQAGNDGASARPVSFHSDRQFVAQPRRTLVRRDHPAADSQIGRAHV